MDGRTDPFLGGPRIAEKPARAPRKKRCAAQQKASGRLVGGSPKGEHHPIDWAELFGLIVTATGWTYEQVGNLSLPEAEELLAYWADHPPVHIQVAGIAAAWGVKFKSGSGKTPRLSPEEHNAGLAAFLGSFGGRIGYDQSREEVQKLLGIDEEIMAKLVGGEPPRAVIPAKAGIQS
jgi:hypothetical protein